MITLSANPIYKQAYDLIQTIEKCGASVEITAAVTEAGRLMDSVKELIKSNEALKDAQVKEQPHD